MAGDKPGHDEREWWFNTTGIRSRAPSGPLLAALRLSSGAGNRIRTGTDTGSRIRRTDTGSWTLPTDMDSWTLRTDTGSRIRRTDTGSWTLPTDMDSWTQSLSHRQGLRPQARC
jgi:hypothetical protein